MTMKESMISRRNRRIRGQSIVELALMTPVLLIILSGIFEFGFLFSSYLAVSDAVRNSARFSSDSDYLTHDTKTDCSGTNATTDFYRQTACQAVAELLNESPTITLCLPNSPADRHCPRPWAGMDDIIVSVFSVVRNPSVPPDPVSIEIKRFPRQEDLAGNPIWIMENGWSYDVDLQGGNQLDARSGMHASTHSTADIMSKLDTISINTGFILVEVNYNYYQVLALPWFTEFIHDPIEFHLYALWPLPSAEPTPTPH